MKHLLNTLFVTSQDAYLALEGETVVVYREKQAAGRFPLHTLSGILSFSYAGASPALMGGLCPEGCVSGVLHAPGTVSRPGIRGILRECAAAADTVPDSR